MIVIIDVIDRQHHSAGWSGNVGGSSEEDFCFEEFGFEW